MSIYPQRPQFNKTSIFQSWHWQETFQVGRGERTLQPYPFSPQDLHSFGALPFTSLPSPCRYQRLLQPFKCTHQRGTHTFHQPNNVEKMLFTSAATWNRTACSLHSPKKHGDNSTNSQVLSGENCCPSKQQNLICSYVHSLLQGVPHLFQAETLLDVLPQRTVSIFPDKSPPLQKTDTCKPFFFRGDPSPNPRSSVVPTP